MRKLMLMALVALMMGACDSGQKEESKDDSRTMQSREERLAEIEELERRLMKINTTEMNRPIAEQIVLEYRDFAIANSKDSLAPYYLFKAADVSVGLGKNKQAIGFLNSVIEEYPNYDRNVEMMLFRGFIFEQHMNQHAQAVEAYQALIDRYPNHRLARDAKASIENLTMSEEDLIKKFKAQNADLQEKES